MAAYGLMEVLVALAIISTAMVIAMQITMKNLVLVKDNEIIDLVNAMSLQALEIAKDPSKVTINAGATPPLTVGNVNGSYNITFNTISKKGSLIRVASAVTSNLTSTCNSSNPYYLKVTQTTQLTATTADICIEMIIQKISSPGASSYYQITANTKYSYKGVDKTKTYLIYRKDDFIIS